MLQGKRSGTWLLVAATLVSVAAGCALLSNVDRGKIQGAGGSGATGGTAATGGSGAVGGVAGSGGTTACVGGAGNIVSSGGAPSAGLYRCDGKSLEQRAADGSWKYVKGCSPDQCSGQEVRRWTGSEWGAGSACLDGTPFYIAGVDDNDVWVVTMNSMGGASGVGIWHWNNGWWTEVDAFETKLQVGWTSALRDSAGRIWIFSPGVLRWDNGTRSDVSPCNVAVGNVNAPPGGEPWAIGGSSVSDERVALRWNGAGWTPIPVPSGRQMQKVWAAADADAWALATPETGGAGGTGGGQGPGGTGGTTAPNEFLLHWDGSTWAEADQLEPCPGGGCWAGMEFTGLAANDIWFGGGEAHWDGLDWKNIPSPAPPRIWKTSAGNVMGLDAVIGGYGCSPQSMRVYSFNGASWDEVTTGLGTALSPLHWKTPMVWASPADNVWLFQWFFGSGC